MSLKSFRLEHILLVFLASALCLASCTQQNPDISHSLNKGIGFIEKTQLKTGEFPIEQCKNYSMQECKKISSVFSTALISSSLNSLNKIKAERINKRAVSFLITEQDNGLWSYYSKRSKERLPPDMDDTAVASMALEAMNVDSSQNKKILEENTDSEGLFLTWFDAEKNNVDCVVNANVISYLKREYQAPCNYINNAITEGKERECSVYYPNKVALYYSASNAYKRGVSCFEPAKYVIIKQILEEWEEKEDYNSLELALSISTLINLGYEGSEINEMVGILISKQDERGSWEKEVFFTDRIPRYYGSCSLTTSFALEAISKYDSVFG